MNKGYMLTNYGNLLEELVVRDLKIKYRRSVLGYLWSVLNPLLMMCVLTLVFSTLFRFDIPNYPVYLLSGQLLYNFFSESTSMAMGAILGSASLIKKVYVPKYIFPLSKLISSFITMLFSLVALVVVMVVTGSEFHVTLILFPLVLTYVFVFSLGIGLLVSTLVVFFRDIEHLYGVLLTAFMYLTPVFYPESILPEWIRAIIQYNPMKMFIDVFRDVFMYGQWPTLYEHLICLFFSFSALFIGSMYFKMKQEKFILYI